jgi:hypothetical protein
MLKQDDRTRFYASTSILMKSALAIALCLFGASLSVAQSPVLEQDGARKVPGQMGNSTAYVIRSSILGETRRINIATPVSFEASGANRRYPVAIVFDGESSSPQRSLLRST